MGIGFEEKKRMVKQAYPGPIWANKVDLMPMNQVIAIYERLKTDGKLVYAADLKKKGYIYHQITLKEWINDVGNGDNT